jgi:surface protein
MKKTLLITFLLALIVNAVTAANYYTYTILKDGSSYKVALSDDFKAQVNKASGGSFTASDGTTWKTGDPLPAPKLTYNDGTNGEKKVTDMSGMFSSCSAMTNLNLSKFNTENVTNMNSMFFECILLKFLNLSTFNTENVTDMSWMFGSCVSMTNLYVSTFNTAKVTNMYYMFYYCKALTNLDLSSFDISKVTSFYRMFTKTCANNTLGTPYKGYVKNQAIADKFNDSSATEIDANKLKFYSRAYYSYTILEDGSGYKVALSDAFKEEVNKESGGTFTGDDGNTWKTGDPLPAPALTYNDGTNGEKKVTSMNKMFGSLSLATQLDLSKFNTVNITDMSWMFSHCYMLSSLDLRKLNTENVTDMSYMFYSCSRLQTLYVDKFNTSKAITMDFMFFACKSLTSLDVRNFNTANVGYMYEMFGGCEALTSLDVSNFNTSKVITMISMFSNCAALTSLDLSSFDISKVIQFDNMLKGTCSANKSGAPYKGYAKNQATADKFNDSSATGIDLTKLKFEIEKSSYYTYTILEDGSGYKVALTDEFKAQVNKASDGSFTASDGTTWKTLEALPAPALTYNDGTNGEKNVTDMSGMFYECKVMTRLDLRNFNTENVVDMHNMFFGCKALLSLNLRTFNTAKVKHMSYMFYGCKAMQNVYLGTFNTSMVTNMSNMFAGCSALTDLDLTNFDTKKVMSMYYMFYNCSALKHINLTTFNTSMVTNMSNMFAGCSALTSLDLSSFNISRVTAFSKMLTNTCSANASGTPYPGKTTDQATADKFNDSSKTGIDITKLKFEMEIPAFYSYTILEDGSGYHVALTDDFKYQVNKASGGTFTAEGTTWTTGEALPAPKTTYNNGTNGEKNVTDMRGMFLNFDVMTSLDLSNFNTSKVTNMYNMFCNCFALTNLNVSSFSTSNVTDMSFMFCRCALTSFDLKNFNTMNVNFMSSMFSECAALKTVDVSSFITTNVNDMSYMFSYCKALEGLDLSSFNITSATGIEEMFTNTCENNKSGTPYKGLARNQATADMLNSDTNIHTSKLKFIDVSTTGINGVNVDDSQAKNVYDLSGVKVNAPQKGRIYIVNGKKIKY